MTTETAQGYSFTPHSIGPDWLTATAKRGLSGRAFREYGERLVDEERTAGGDVQPAVLRDYVGHRGKGFYFGTRPADRILIVSGPRCPPHFASIAEAASGVSRLDLQVTVWTHGEQPNLAIEAYHTLQRAPPTRGRPRKLSLIQSKPCGETLNVGSRQSDAYGRLYDWSSAHKAGSPLTLWRYEVEYKRHLARRVANMLLRGACATTVTGGLVHDWYHSRGIQPTWTIEDHSLASNRSTEARDRDVLDWFERSLKKTVAKAINRHGLNAVIDALGLTPHVGPRAEGNGTNGT